MKIPYWPIYTGPNKDFNNSVLRVKCILSELNNPHLQLKNVIHITGTKGKGSTALYISNILKASGYVVNTYISPHIYECNERILLNGNKITDEKLNEITEVVRYVCEQKNSNNPFNKEGLIEPAMFEALTCSAFYAMSQNNADFNVIEVGMGGLNDATNVFDKNPPIACVFTPIHLDHTKFLGDTIQQIALNKSFLIKKNTKNVILSSQAKEVKTVLKKTANELEVPSVISYKDDYEVFYDKNNQPVYESSYFDTCFPFQRPNMSGDYQLINAGCAISVCLSCQKNSIANKLTLDAINTGIKNTINIVRMQQITNGTLFSQLPQGSIFYIDGAHNQLAAHALASWINEFKKQYNTNDYKICIAVARTKNANNISFLQEFLDKEKKPIADLIIATRANLESIPEPPENIAKAAKKLGFVYKTAYNINEVVKCCIDNNNEANSFYKKKILLICTGSLYIARDISVANL